jgi:hypothetical protein
MISLQCFQILGVKVNNMQCMSKEEREHFKKQMEAVGKALEKSGKGPPYVQKFPFYCPYCRSPRIG